MMVSPLPEGHLVRLCTSLGDVHPIDPRLLGEASEILHTAFTAYTFVPPIEEPQKAGHKDRASHELHMVSLLATNSTTDDTKTLLQLHCHRDIDALPRGLLHLLRH